MIGRKLGGRYEILERIGGGGMALVYKGQDLLLNRKVAVKVLRQQYVHDEEFIRRFRREAQAAASLSHPNVVSIYDVGQEDEVHYIVMEYIEGTTLNDLIKEKAPLQVEEAVHYAGQIADALDHAHHNEIIHRDIKPHNILIGKNGRVKVTDFGIARAATSSTITQTGSVVGSVHYFSPEHAKGTNTGEKSDLYSLGIVMYQMLTARLPFLGESPISVALKHLQEEVEEPRKVNPLIPQSVENIILKAMRKKPEERYQSAKLMMADLETCLSSDRRNEAKVAFWDADGMDEERTLVMPAIRPNQLGDFKDAELERATLREEPTPPKSKGWVKPLVWIVILLVILGAMWYMVGYVKGMFAIETVEVPNVENKPLQQAQAELTAAKLGYIIELDQDSKLAKDTVIRQDPNGVRMNVGTKVTLYVSKGVRKITMENYVGQPLKDVKLKLQALGIKEDQITIAPGSIEDTPDMIQKQAPLVGVEFEAEKAAIVFTISKAKETFKMPDLVGMSEGDAKAQIAKLNLKLPVNGITREKSYKIPKGKVIKQFPFEKNQDVSVGVEISLIISDGLPEDAGQLNVSIPVKPTEEGKDSEFKIVVSDAQYENFEYKPEKVTKPQNLDVKVIVSPDKKAVILIKEGDNLVNSVTRTYQDYLDQKSGKNASPSPSASPSTSPKQQNSGAAIPVGGNGNGQEPTSGNTSKPGTGGGN
ncbi:Stk1 family PASTA domain-containing Ser/Thr kinase [Paenibacillus sp. SYP-B3998]|uniref:Serine/threonine-protein kinase PrkC n=1 Tax=Paenibacillus sp. SYP-B3998 TaxID=2678564 RepID=A0A6G3ZTC5_9BACL|nr:Stk1 family PASTA domain-containing Ser/Thr kinase [Paenibacillus sp. SYP-B3998]NEW05466.1 Stk1 family PASTA domain-containing Ser/Thr kinase [Paenibacillus sp. SYP-B3998]